MKDLSPIGWAVRPLKRYAEFSGRSSRAEFWWFFLGMFVFWIGAMIFLFGALAGLGASRAQPSAGLLAGLGIGWLVLILLFLALLIPSLAVQVRRLHDTDRSGWWLGAFYLLYLVYAVFMVRAMLNTISSIQAGGTPPDPAEMSGSMGVASLIGLLQFVYFIVLIVFYCLAGTKGVNRFGEDPYGPDVEQVFA